MLPLRQRGRMSFQRLGTSVTTSSRTKTRPTQILWKAKVAKRHSVTPALFVTAVVNGRPCFSRIILPRSAAVNSSAQRPTAMPKAPAGASASSSGGSSFVSCSARTSSAARIVPAKAPIRL